jgi:hypothetical protein
MLGTEEGQTEDIMSILWIQELSLVVLRGDDKNDKNYDDDEEEEDNDRANMDGMSYVNSSISDDSDTNVLSQAIDSLTLGSPNTPKKNAAHGKNGSSDRRIKTVFE